MKTVKQKRHQLYLTLDENKTTNHPYDGLEVRLDRIDLNVAARFVQRKPFIITLAGRFDLLDSAIAMRPNYIDLDVSAPPELFERVRNSGVELIISCHSYEGIPELPKEPASIYKIAVYVESAMEAFRVLELSASNVIAIPMGKRGRFGRLMAPILGQPLSFTAVEPFAPGQFSIDELQNYRFRSLSQSTELYGLIGNPVEQSPSHITHNRAFEALGRDALYVKIPVDCKECAEVLQYLRRFDFRGVSVTMPLKERVVLGKNFNTLKRVGSRFEGLNTDGSAAVDAIEKRVVVAGRRVVILGAGGCARAIGAEAEKRGGLVTFLGRRDIEIGAIPACEVLVQATPVGMRSGDPMLIDPGKVGRDVVLLETIHTPLWTPLRTALAKKGCSTIGGLEMFYKQAEKQFLYWE